MHFVPSDKWSKCSAILSYSVCYVWLCIKFFPLLLYFNCSRFNCQKERLRNLVIL